jgi:hypothetical protein
VNPKRWPGIVKNFVLWALSRVFPSAAYLRELEDEIARLEGISRALIDPKLARMTLSEGGVLEMVMKTPMMNLWAAWAGEMFRQTPEAINYLSWRFGFDGDPQHYDLTVRKADKKTPAEVAAETKALLKEMTRAHVDACGDRDIAQAELAYVRGRLSGLDEHIRVKLKAWGQERDRTVEESHACAIELERMGDEYLKAIQRMHDEIAARMVPDGLMNDFHALALSNLGMTDTVWDWQRQYRELWQEQRRMLLDDLQALALREDHRSTVYGTCCYCGLPIHGYNGMIMDERGMLHPICAAVENVEEILCEGVDW